jgi:Tfp pilus assembly protein PilV
MKNPFISHNSSPKGYTKAFTLVETLVAISILTLAVTGPLLIAQKGIGSSIYARDQITAFYLAQEAVEYIRNVRDTNRITGQWWLAQFSSCQPYNSAVPACSSLNGMYKIDSKYLDFTNDQGTPSDFTDDTVNASAISTCSGSCPVLQFDTTNNLYTYSGGTLSPTQFTRTITINNTISSKEALVQVTIAWNPALIGGFTRSFVIKEYLFNF